MVGKIKDVITLPIEHGEQMPAIAMEAVVYGEEKDIAIYGIAKILNQFAVQGVMLGGMSFSVHLPIHSYSSRIKTMAKEIKKSCKEHQVSVIEIKSQRNPVIETSMVVVTGYGYLEKEADKTELELDKEASILLLNEVALEGGYRILDMKKDTVEERFPTSFFDAYKKKKDRLFIDEELGVCRQLNNTRCFAIGDGGIQATFNQVCEELSVGIDIDMKSITISQETIELCEFMGMNPFRLCSTGAALIVTTDVKECLALLCGRGIKATRIGKTTEELDRVVRKGTEKAFLERPTEDEILKIFVTE